jgi:hypothetical protein
MRVAQTIKPQRHIKIKAHANPFDPSWEAYFQQRDRQLTLRASSPVRATILSQQQGECPGCRQVIQYDQDIEWHHREGNHQKNSLSNLVFLQQFPVHQSNVIIQQARLVKVFSFRKGLGIHCPGRPVLEVVKDGYAPFEKASVCTWTAGSDSSGVR